MHASSALQLDLWSPNKGVHKVMRPQALWHVHLPSMCTYTWWHIPVVPSLRRLVREEDCHEFEASLGSSVNSKPDWATELRLS